MSIDTDLADERPVLETIGDPGGAPERVVEVRRRPGPAAALGAGASLVALAYLARAADGGGVVDWVLGIVLGLIGVANLVALVDARTPLLVADDLGVRLRLGRTWVGLPWGGLHEIDHTPSARWWRDGLLTVRTHYVQRVLEDLDPAARRTARLNRRLHRSPLAVPIGLGTRVVGAPFGLIQALRELADGRTPVIETVPVATIPVATVEEAEPGSDEAVAAELPAAEPQTDLGGWRTLRLPDPRPAVADLIGRVAARLDRRAPAVAEGVLDDDEYLEDDDPAYDEPGFDDPVGDPVDEEREVVASATPLPVRDTLSAARAEIRHESRADLDEAFGEDTQVWEALHAVPMAQEPLVIGDDLDDLHDVPRPEPVIGPQFAAARERLGLTVDQLAERTRIRPHVIEAIEVDDFGACGGDFYARGHLRTLARVLGVEATPMLATYDERYADAPIDPRAVFEADLAGAGSIRATRGGPNWSVLVAAVMALVLCWSVARLVTGGPGRSPDEAVLSGSGGPNHSRSVLTKPVPVTLTAAGGGARVVVRDGLGKLVFTGDLAYGQKHTVQASPPVRIQATDGSVQVSVDGQDRGRMGPAGRPASQTYVGRR
jgi:cytoskeletal protein RodZ